MKSLFLICLLFISYMAKAQNTFKAEQLKFERVSAAYHQKWSDLDRELIRKGFKDDFSILINAYKSEGKVEIWLKTKANNKYTLFKIFDFCAHSGKLGPKLTEGDGQTPEGFYSINVFNPMSTYYLSLGLNYPNTVDSNRTGIGRSPGSDIYIHGNCVTVGCIPITDDKIKEVYILAVEARQSGQEQIPVNIFPFKMTAGNIQKYTAQFPEQQSFWKILQQPYLYFEKNKHPMYISEKQGNYVFKPVTVNSTD